MKRFSEQFQHMAERVKLTKAESRDLKARLQAYLEYHPLPDAAATRAPASSQLASEPFWVWRINTPHTRAFATVCTLAVLIIMPFAAERSVPGDVLYPVKVRFNEEIRSSLAVTPHQQIEWETKRVERRLAEARLLATEGKLTEALEAEVAAAVKSHTEAAQASLEQLRETDSEEATIAELTFASSLDVQSEVLERETARQQAAGASTTATLAATIADVRAKVAQVDTKGVSFERLLARVEEETTHATELLWSLEGDLSPEERTDIDRRLDDITRKVELAISAQQGTVVSASIATTTTSTTSSATTTRAAITTELATTTEPIATAAVGDTSRAKEYLREALQATQKLIRFMTDIDVKLNLSVDELVPLELTDEERLTLMETERARLAATWDEANTRATTAADEKVSYTLSRVAALLNTIDTALANQDPHNAERAAAEARALLADLDRLLDEMGARVATSTPNVVATTTATGTPPATTTSTRSTTSQTLSATTTPDTEATENSEPM